MWLSQDRLFIENLASNNRSDQLKELGKIAAAYRIARNLPLAGDKHKDKKRYEPVLKIINRISGPVEEKKVICLVTKTKKEICEEYNINEALSLTTKFLWFKFQSPILIYDSRARNALKTETGNYENFCKEWKKGSSRIHVESNAEVHHFRTHSFLTGYQVQDTARWESKIQ